MSWSGAQRRPRPPANASRNRRLTRLRSTAPPTLPIPTGPSAGASSPGWGTSTGPRWRLALRAAVPVDAVEVGAARQPAAWRRGLMAASPAAQHGQALAALVAAALERVAAGARAHPGSEAMGSRALRFLGWYVRFMTLDVQGRRASIRSGLAAPLDALRAISHALRQAPSRTGIPGQISVAISPIRAHPGTLADESILSTQENLGAAENLEWTRAWGQIQRRHRSRASARRRSACGSRRWSRLRGPGPTSCSRRPRTSSRGSRAVTRHMIGAAAGAALGPAAPSPSRAATRAARLRRPASASSVAPRNAASPSTRGNNYSSSSSSATATAWPTRPRSPSPRSPAMPTTRSSSADRPGVGKTHLLSAIADTARVAQPEPGRARHDR